MKLLFSIQSIPYILEKLETGQFLIFKGHKSTIPLSALDIFCNTMFKDLFKDTLIYVKTPFMNDKDDSCKGWYRYVLKKL